MKTSQREQRIYEILAAAVSVVLLVMVCSLVWGCTTVTPKIVAGPAQTAEEVTKIAGGFLITQEQRERYNDLIKLGYGSEKHYLPALKKDDGIIVKADGSIFMDDVHAADFAAMNILHRSGIAP